MSAKTSKMWKLYPKQMKALAARRERLVKALLLDKGLDLRKLATFKAAGTGEAVLVKFKGRRRRVPFLTYKGLCALAARLGVPIPPEPCTSPLGPQRLSDQDEGCMCPACAKRGPDTPELWKPKRRRR